jgi:hypothetical protein
MQLYRFTNLTKFLLVIFFISALNTVISQNRYSGSSYSEKLMKSAQNILDNKNSIQTNKKHFVRDGLTLIKLEAKRNWSILTPEAKRYFLKIMQRPNWLKKNYISKSNFFQVWYNTGSDKDAVEPNFDTNNNGTPDVVEYTANALDAAYNKYLATGFVMPYPVDPSNTRPPFIKTKFDVYLTNTDCGDSYGSVGSEITIGDNPNSTTVVENNSSSSSMELRSSYLNFGDVGDDTAKANIAIEVTTAHEFMHAIQMGYNVDMSSFVMEMCATWGESFNYPALYDNFQYNDEFTRPDVALDYDNSEDITDYQDHWYASWYYMRYLTDHYSETTVKTLYEGLLNFDYIPVLNSLLIQKGIDFLTSIKNFFVSNSLMSSKSVCQPYTYSLADAYRTEFSNRTTELAYEKQFSYNGSDINYNSQIDGNSTLMRLSADYFTITPNDNFSVKLSLAKSTDSLSLILLKTDAPINPNKLTVSEGARVSNDISINVSDKSQYTNFILLVVNIKTKRDAVSSQYTIKISRASVTYSISGKMKDYSGNGIQNVNVIISGGSQGTVSTGADGSYSFNNLDAAKSYTITPTKQGYTFVPSLKTFDNLSKNETQDFVGTAIVNKYNISGVVRDNNGIGMANVTVTLSGGSQGTMTTGADGSYSFNNLDAAKSYTITPAKQGYTFTPTLKTIDNLSKNETQDFVGTAIVIKYNISGVVRDNNGIGITNVTVTLSGGSQGTVTTGPDGSYSFNNLDAAKSYTITPTKQGYTFTPALKTIDNLNKNETQDFVGTAIVIKYNISGVVRDNNGIGMANVTVTLSGGSQGTMTTGADGSYNFNNLDAAKSYTITPAKQGYTFVPSLKIFDNLSKNETQDFVGVLIIITYKIDGYTLNKDSSPLKDVLINLSGGKISSTQTGADGYFKFENLDANKSYTITPTFRQIVFNPSSITIDSLKANQSITFISTTQVGIFSMNNLPEDVTLYSNFPNPFNPGTTIQYEINASMKIKIQVYNSLGILISTLYDGYQLSGLHKVQFDAQNLASGTYFVKLLTSNGIRTISINLLK